MKESVTLDKLRETKYGRIICYPRYSPKENERRLEEMRTLGINALEFIGEKRILDLPILGKGCVSIVLLTHTGFGPVALKIRRTDADRSGMMHEAKMLQLANSVNVGPTLISYTNNLLVMEFVDGLLIPKWIKKVSDRNNRARITSVLLEVLEQSWRLDNSTLDHGELSRASGHIIVDSRDRTYLLDFETASTDRRASNVTSICQYLFMRSEVADAVKKISEIDEERLIGALRIYKKDHSRERFEEILKTCNLWR